MKPRKTTPFLQKVISLVPPIASTHKVFLTKYCEAYGRLALREDGSAKKYCSGCAAAMAALPKSQGEVWSPAEGRSRRRADD